MAYVVSHLRGCTTLSLPPACHCRALSRYSRRHGDRQAQALANSEAPQSELTPSTISATDVQEELELQRHRVSSQATAIGDLPFYAHISSFRRKVPGLQERLARVMMHDGKKSVAERVLFQALCTVGQQTGYPPHQVLALAVEKATPLIENRGIASGSRKLQVPTPMTTHRAEGMALRWIVEAARKRSRAQPMTVKLAAEIVDAANGQGAAVRRRNEQHKDAERNKVNAHLRTISM